MKFNEGKYEYSVLKTVNLFGRGDSYKEIEVALEALLSFKVIYCVKKKKKVLCIKDIYKTMLEPNKAIEKSRTRNKLE